MAAVRQDATSVPGLSEGQEANDEWTVTEEGPISNLRSLFQENRVERTEMETCKTGRSAACEQSIYLVTLESSSIRI